MEPATYKQFHYTTLWATAWPMLCVALVTWLNNDAHNREYHSVPCESAHEQRKNIARDAQSEIQGVRQLFFDREGDAVETTRVSGAGTGRVTKPERKRVPHRPRVGRAAAAVPQP